MRFGQWCIVICVTIANSACNGMLRTDVGIEVSMFNNESIRALRFLEGRWSGQAPDGSAFFEEHDFPDVSTMRSRRYRDASFSEASDGSTVALRDGEVISTWGEFTWVAVDIRSGAARFRPINAPSSFSWNQVDEDTVEVNQTWNDENGVEQHYSLILNRVR